MVDVHNPETQYHALVSILSMDPTCVGRDKAPLCNYIHVIFILKDLVCIHIENKAPTDALCRKVQIGSFAQGMCSKVKVIFI